MNRTRNTVPNKNVLRVYEVRRSTDGSCDIDTDMTDAVACSYHAELLIFISSTVALVGMLTGLSVSLAIIGASAAKLFASPIVVQWICIVVTLTSFPPMREALKEEKRRPSVTTPLYFVCSLAFHTLWGVLSFLICSVLLGKVVRVYWNPLTRDFRSEVRGIRQRTLYRNAA